MLLDILGSFFGDFFLFTLHVESRNIFPKPLSKNEETEAFALMAQGDENARSRLIEHNLRLVAHMDKLSKAAVLFGIDVTLLLDDYNLFIYNGQGQQIKRLRKSLKLTQSEFARYIDAPLGTLKQWEQNKVCIQKKTFKKLSQLINAYIDV